MLLEHHKEAEKTTMCTLKITLFVFNYRKKKLYVECTRHRHSDLLISSAATL